MAAGLLGMAAGLGGNVSGASQHAALQQIVSGAVEVEHLVSQSLLYIAKPPLQ